MAFRVGFPALWFFLVLLASGCVSGPTAIKVGGSIQAAPDLNPDYNGRPSPVVVRVYQLRSAGVFENADFFSLYDNEASVLAADLVARDEMEMGPGETRAYSKEMDLATRYVGVVAAFRDLDNAQWRAVVPLGEAKSVSLSIQLDSRAVSVSTGEP